MKQKIENKQIGFLNHVSSGQWTRPLFKNIELDLILKSPFYVLSRKFVDQELPDFGCAKGWAFRVRLAYLFDKGFN